MKFIFYFKAIFGIFIFFSTYSIVCYGSVDIQEAVKGKVYRGAALYSEEDFNTLKDFNIKTILNLNVIGVSAEERFSKKYGIQNYLNIPIIPFPSFFPIKPSKVSIEKGLKILSDPNLQPIYVHCTYGHERTGLLIALYKIRYENLSPKDAAEDMFAHQFHKILTYGLYRYFIEHEFDPKPPEIEESFDLPTDGTKSNSF